MRALVEILNNTRCRISEVPVKVLRELDEALAMPIEGAHFAGAGRRSRGHWDDGKRHLFYRAKGKKSGTFPFGLVSRVRQLVSEHGILCKTVDLRSNVLPRAKLGRLRPDMLLGSSPGGEPIRMDGKYAYQLQAARAALRAQSGILWLATNSGKSAIAIAMMMVLAEHTVLFVVPKRKLLYDMRKRIAENLGTIPEEIGIIGDGRFDPKEITVAIINSVTSKRLSKKKKYSEATLRRQTVLKRYLAMVEVVFLDEGHHCICRQQLDVLRSGHVQTIKIEEVQIGDQVQAWDNTKVVWRQVTSTFRYKAPETLIRLVWSEGELICTSNHEIWTKKGYIEAGAFTAGDCVYLQGLSQEVQWLGAIRTARSSSCGGGESCVRLEAHTLVAVEEVRSQEKYVYDIEVEQNHNYFLKNRLLVSNSRANSWYNLMTSLRNAQYRYILSGTPFGSGNALMVEATVGPVIARVSNDELVKLGVSAKPLVHMVEIEEPNLDDLGRSKNAWHSVYQQGVVYNETRNNVLVDYVAHYSHRGMRTMILVRQLAQGDMLRSLLRARDINAEFVHGKTPPAWIDTAVARFEEDKNAVLIASTIFDEGVDIPAMRALVIADAGKSFRATLQKIGRALRKKKGRNVVDVIDCADLTHKWLSDHSLERLDIYEAEGFEVRLEVPGDIQAEEETRSEDVKKRAEENSEEVVPLLPRGVVFKDTPFESSQASAVGGRTFDDPRLLFESSARMRWHRRCT